jgi:hypothetical protein
MINTPILVKEDGVIVGFTQGAVDNLELMGFELSTGGYLQEEYSAIQYKPREKRYLCKSYNQRTRSRKSNAYIIRPLT